MNNYSAQRIYEMGVKVRNPSLYRLYEELKSSEWLSSRKLYDIQGENAKRLLCHAYNSSPFYKTLFEKYGFNPDSYSEVKDLSRLPELDKRCLIEHNDAIHAQNINEPVKLAETSGTSGESLSFKRGESWDSLNRAAMMRAYDWYDVKPWQKNGYLWGYNISKSQRYKIKLLDALQNRFRLFDYSARGIETFAKKLSNSVFLTGYSSMVYEVAKLINELDIEIPPLKLVKGTSEMIIDVHHQESMKAFGRRVTSEYGAAEAGLIAFECPEGGLHINIENVILENNSEGEVLVTNLWSYSFPIIRYNLGDIITLSDRRCSCGREHPLIEEIQGRKGVPVYGFRQKYPSLTFYYVFKNIALKYNVLINYKVKQKEVGRVCIYIEGESSDFVSRRVREQIDDYFGLDLEASLIFVSRFRVDQKKAQYFESDL